MKPPKSGLTIFDSAIVQAAVADSGLIDFLVRSGRTCPRVRYAGFDRRHQSNTNRLSCAAGDITTIGERAVVISHALWGPTTILANFIDSHSNEAPAEKNHRKRPPKRLGAGSRLIDVTWSHSIQVRTFHKKFLQSFNAPQPSHRISPSDRHRVVGDHGWAGRIAEKDFQRINIET